MLWEWGHWWSNWDQLGGPSWESQELQWSPFHVVGLGCTLVSVPQNKRSCTVELEREIRVAFSQPVCAELGIFCVGESLGKCWAVEVIPRDVMSVCWGCGDLLEGDREGKCWQSFLLPTGQHRGGESGWAFLGSFCCSGTSRVPFVLFQTESGKTGHAVPQPWEWFPFDKPAFDATSILSGLFFFFAGSSKQVRKKVVFSL